MTPEQKDQLVNTLVARFDEQMDPSDVQDDVDFGFNEDEFFEALKGAMAEVGWKYDYDRIVTDPGKYEGERVAVVFAYEAMLNGAADEGWDAQGVPEFTANVDGQDVTFWIDDQGFVREVKP